MQAALAARLELEVLDRIGDVASRALEPGLLEADVEQASGRADERAACNILLVARLFADEHDVGLLRSLAEDELGGVLVEFAACAALRLMFKLIEAGGVGAFKREGGAKFRCDVHGGNLLASTLNRSRNRLFLPVRNNPGPQEFGADWNHTG
jgi:hypothetical protein